MRISLVYAGIAGKGFGSLKQGMDSGWISHGLASLSSYAKSQGFTDVNLIDLRALDDWEDYRRVLAERKPDVLGLTMMSVDYNPVCDSAKIAKEVNPNVITVVGGAHPTAEPDSVLANPNFDYVVTAEGEITFANLLKAIQDGRRPQERLLVGIHPVLDRLPFADRDLFLDEWRKFGYDLESPEVPFVEELPGPFVTIIAGRGCRYKCNFCKPMEDYLFGRRHAAAQRGQRSGRAALPAGQVSLQVLHVPRRLPDRGPRVGDGVLHEVPGRGLHAEVLLPEPGRHHLAARGYGGADGQDRAGGLLHRL